MNRLTRLMYAGRGLHRHQVHSELRLRGWALLRNFRPSARAPEPLANISVRLIDSAANATTTIGFTT